MLRVLHMNLCECSKSTNAQTQTQNHQHRPTQFGHDSDDEARGMPTIYSFPPHNSNKCVMSSWQKIVISFSFSLSFISFLFLAATITVSAAIMQVTITTTILHWSFTCLVSATNFFVLIFFCCFVLRFLCVRFWLLFTLLMCKVSIGFFFSIKRLVYGCLSFFVLIFQLELLRMKMFSSCFNNEWLTHTHVRTK